MNNALRVHSDNYLDNLRQQKSLDLALLNRNGILNAHPELLGKNVQMARQYRTAMTPDKGPDRPWAKRVNVAKPSLDHV